jgi:hypothetical protein
MSEKWLTPLARRAKNKLVMPSQYQKSYGRQVDNTETIHVNLST